MRPGYVVISFWLSHPVSMFNVTNHCVQLMHTLCLHSFLPRHLFSFSWHVMPNVCSSFDFNLAFSLHTWAYLRFVELASIDLFNSSVIVVSSRFSTSRPHCQATSLSIKSSFTCRWQVVVSHIDAQLSSPSVEQSCSKQQHIFCIMMYYEASKHPDMLLGFTCRHPCYQSMFSFLSLRKPILHARLRQKLAKYFHS